MHMGSFSYTEATIHIVSPDDLYHKLSTCLTCMPKVSDSSPSVDVSTTSTERHSSISINGISDTNGSSDTLRKLYICKWVDYSNKYGFGAELSDGSVLVRFNDGSKMTLTRDRQ